MPGRTPREAVGRFLDTLELAASCLRPTKLIVSTEARTKLGELHGLRAELPLPLRWRETGLVLSVALQYEIVRRDDRPASERFKVSTRRYQHHLLTADDSREVLLFHWHPTTGHGPHIHVSEAKRGGHYNARSHVPAGRVTVESVIRFALAELGAEPGRSDWAAVLNRCERDFVDFKTW